MSELELFRDKFQVGALSVARTEHWELSIRPQQLTLGSMVLSVRANVLDFASLNEIQSGDMAALIGLAEQRVKARFGAIRINVLCLMMQDPLLHFHIFPRYDGPVTFEGVEWIDEDWPGPPQVRPAQEHVEVNRALLTVLQQPAGA